jgi:AraC family transcriptional regulator, transcriptional activator FtrA
MGLDPAEDGEQLHLIMGAQLQASAFPPLLPVGRAEAAAVDRLGPHRAAALRDSDRGGGIRGRPLRSLPGRAAHGTGVRIAALCTGAFVLAAAGLLDGRTAATHWMHAEQLARLHPAVNVRADVLYVDDGQVLTPAGKTAALDLCLHLVDRDHGASPANGLARRLVVAAHSPGGQAQFIAPLPGPRVTGGLGPTLHWASAHLDDPLTAPDLARESGLSTRQLARRMRAEVGLTPLGWLHQQRITRARAATLASAAVRCGGG